MKKLLFGTLSTISLVACATSTADDPRERYVELSPATTVAAPSAVTPAADAEQRERIERGRYMVGLLGCGTCHTDGALVGAPDLERRLAGSGTGIAYSNPLGDERPGIVFPPNITPDDETGIGRLNDQQIINAIRVGQGTHGQRRIVVMPWQAYSRVSAEDAAAIAAYLKSIPAVDHEVPDSVRPGQKSDAPFVYFGVYQSSD